MSVYFHDPQWRRKTGEKKLNGNPEMKISAQLNTAGRFFYDEKRLQVQKKGKDLTHS